MGIRGDSEALEPPRRHMQVHDGFGEPWRHETYNTYPGPRTVKPPSRRTETLKSNYVQLKHHLVALHSGSLVSLGHQPNTTDTLVLHADQTILESLRYEGAGKPLCLGTVITELVNSRTAVPLQQFLSASQSIYDPGWLPYRVAAFVVGKPLSWALQQLNVLGSDDESEAERWKRTRGDYVLIGVLEHAADSVLASQRARDLSLAETLYSFDSFRATFAASALPGVTLSDKDLRVLIRFLERDRRTVVTGERYCTFSAWLFKHRAHCLQVIKFVGTGFGTPEVTAIDHGALELKSAVSKLTAQIDNLTAKIDSHKAKAANAIRQQHKSLALSYLRSRKQLEEYSPNASAHSRSFKAPSCASKQPQKIFGS
ncbi:hypothetical protein EI94DRAFT_1789616 [Lactarius quietus]|nr:hypothetical protein EI94DRAFT_1789616 [Lactarius quietus]